MLKLFKQLSDHLTSKNDSDKITEKMVNDDYKSNCNTIRSINDRGEISTLILKSKNPDGSFKF